MESFLDYAFTKQGTESICCPCLKCLNIEFGSPELVHGHVLAYGILKRYTFWYYHWETLDEPNVKMNDGDDMGEPDEMQGILRDLYHDFDDTGSFDHDEQEEELNNEAKRFYRLLKESQHSIYDGCKSSKMYALVNFILRLWDDGVISHLPCY